MMRYKSLIAKVAIFSLVLSLVTAVGPVQAAALTNVSDVMTDQTISSLSSHTITFTLPSGVVWSSTDIATIDFPNFSVSGSTSSADLTIQVAAATETVADSCGGNPDAIAVAVSGTSLVLTACNGYTPEAAGSTVVITYGAAAGGTAVDRVTNPASVDSYNISILLGGEHSSTMQVPIVDSSMVTINAEVEATMTFDLDVGTSTGSDSTSDYVVDLGILALGAVTSSGAGTPLVNMIGVDISANATGGVVVTVKNANGANGLVSTSATGDFIPVDTGTFVAGTEAYNICVHRVAAGANSTLAASAFDADSLSATDGFDDSATCAASVHNVGSTALSASPQSILNSDNAPIAGGRAEIFVKAAISVTTPAHDDYTDTLTFIATGTF